MARMDSHSISTVVEVWAGQTEDLGAQPFIGYVQIFENKGVMMGCSNPHPHCQVWGVKSVPTEPLRKLATQLRYFRAHGTDLLGDYLAREIESPARVICENDGWVALVPFWAYWPFETMLIPRRRVSDLPSLTRDEREALADILKRLNARYDNLFHTSFPYSMGWHGQPVDGGEYPFWRLHAVYYPPLLRSATIRKFGVGYEMTAEPQRDITPEQAADRLREMSERHYLDD